MVPDQLGLWAVTLGLVLLVALTSATSTSNRQLGIKGMGKMGKKASLFFNHLGLEKKHVISIHMVLAITSRGWGGGGVGVGERGCRPWLGSHFCCRT